MEGVHTGRGAGLPPWCIQYFILYIIVLYIRCTRVVVDGSVVLEVEGAGLCTL